MSEPAEDARELFMRIRQKRIAGAEEFDIRVLAHELGWSLDRALSAMISLEEKGLMEWSGRRIPVPS